MAAQGMYTEPLLNKTAVPKYDWGMLLVTLAILINKDAQPDELKEAGQDVISKEKVQ